MVRNTAESVAEDPKHLEDLIIESKRLDLSSMKTLNHLMRNGDSERVRLEASKAWIEHQREIEIQAMKMEEARREQEFKVELLRIQRQLERSNGENDALRAPGAIEDLTKLRESFLNRSSVSVEPLTESEVE